MQVTYTDKDKTILDGERNKWRDSDANEVKAAVNSKADLTELDILYNLIMNMSGLVRLCGSYDLSGGTLAPLNGSGTAGAILKGNQFHVSVGGAIATPDGGTVLKGMVLQAMVDTPGTDLTDPTKWIIFTTITS